MFSGSQIFKFDLKEKERSPFDYKKRAHSQLTYDEKKIKRVLIRKIERFFQRAGINIMQVRFGSI